MPAEDFSLAAVIYALSILERWVQDDDVTNTLTGDASSEQGVQTKKKKKRELPFTREQFTNKLKASLSKYVGTPLHLLGNSRLQMLLKLLLLLVQTLLSSGIRKKDNYSVDVESVRQAITSFLLRRDGDVKISSTDSLAALDEFKQLFRTLDPELKSRSCWVYIGPV
ncbi:hypothetical protein COOONC_17587 [Cooperia oncophora]